MAPVPIGGVLATLRWFCSIWLLRSAELRPQARAEVLALLSLQVPISCMWVALSPHTPSQPPGPHGRCKANPPALNGRGSGRRSPDRASGGFGSGISAWWDSTHPDWVPCHLNPRIHAKPGDVAGETRQHPSSSSKGGHGHEVGGLWLWWGGNKDVPP